MAHLGSNPSELGSGFQPSQVSTSSLSELIPFSEAQRSDDFLVLQLRICRVVVGRWALRSGEVRGHRCFPLHSRPWVLRIRGELMAMTSEVGRWTPRRSGPRGLFLVLVSLMCGVSFFKKGLDKRSDGSRRINPRDSYDETVDGGTDAWLTEPQRLLQ